MKIKKYNIAFVDDDPVFLQIIQKIMAEVRPEIDIECFLTADSILKYPRLEKYKLVVTDLEMPYYPGDRLIGSISNRFPDKYFLICSSHLTWDLYTFNAGSGIQKVVNDSNFRGRNKNTFALSKPISINKFLLLLSRVFKTDFSFKGELVEGINFDWLDICHLAPLCRGLSILFFLLGLIILLITGSILLFTIYH